jgi:hypothetical protein
MTILKKARANWSIIARRGRAARHGYTTARQETVHSRKASHPLWSIVPGREGRDRDEAVLEAPCLSYRPNAMSRAKWDIPSFCSLRFLARRLHRPHNGWCVSACFGGAHLVRLRLRVGGTLDGATEAIDSVSGRQRSSFPVGPNALRSSSPARRPGPSQPVVRHRRDRATVVRERRHVRYDVLIPATIGPVRGGIHRQRKPI